MEQIVTPSKPSSGRRSKGVVLAAVAMPLFGWGALFRVEPQQPAPTPPPQIFISGEKQRFAIPDCIPRAGDEASREACRTITQVLKSDLKFEIDASQFVPDNLITAIPSMNPDAPNFKDWQSIGAGILVVSRAAVTGGELSVEVRVHFVSSGQSMLEKRYSGKPDNPRLFAHQASDDILTLTQLKGVARTRIAFVSDRDSSKEKVLKQVYIMDYDGYNPRQITVSSSINILPAWRPDGQAIAYVSYRQGSPMIFLASIFEGKNTPNLTGERGSQAFAPSWSPDGKRIAFSSTRSGNSEIWVANADGSGARNLTSNPAADTAPVWSPTGQEIAFTSGRTGQPQIYVMDADSGLNIRRLTTASGYSDAPAWSPSRERSEIAYTSRLDSGFEIAVLDLASGQNRQLTEGRGSCEYPSWAPNGRHLVFACNRGGTWQITVSDRDGRNLQTLAAGKGNNVQPDWGP
jgi:TolB protein